MINICVNSIASSQSLLHVCLLHQDKTSFPVLEKRFHPVVLSLEHMNIVTVIRMKIRIPIRCDFPTLCYRIYYSRANAPTGSAGEESVSSCWVAVAGFWWVLVFVVVVDDVVDVVVVVDVDVVVVVVDVDVDVVVVVVDVDVDVVVDDVVVVAVVVVAVVV